MTLIRVTLCQSWGYNKMTNDKLLSDENWSFLTRVKIGACLTRVMHNQFGHQGWMWALEIVRLTTC